MTTIPDAVGLAAAAVDEDAFTRNDDGELIAQTSSQAIITTMIRELGVEPGDAVLEIGTGSGYSTALLSHLTGPTGSVTSLDVMPELTGRAGHLLHANGYAHTRTLTGDGAKGAPEFGPYDKIIAWTTPETVPQAWIAQAAAAATVVTPVNVTGLSKTYAVITAALDHGELIPESRLTRGSFVEMSGQIRTQWLLPPYGIDALHTGPNDTPWWLSSHWLRTQESRALGESLAARLAAEASASTSPLALDDDPLGFYAWLIATRPDGLTTACLGSPAWQIGHSSPHSAALIPLAGAEPLTVVGTPASADAVDAWVEAWRAQGSPGWSALKPEAAQQPDGSWVIRAALAQARS
jgi:protein-L-isoaspartate(D-aspartate) O-methyltransferase